jgi:hypothetical protein
VFPRDIVYLRNISVDTLNKGDTEDNNNNNNKITIIIIRVKRSLRKIWKPYQENIR